MVILILRNPFVVGLLSMLALTIAAFLGRRLRSRRGGDQEGNEDYALVIGGALTLLGLIVGFTFSMAVARYDQRKILEEAEANAIGTEYVRADLLPPDRAAQVRTLLRGYLDQRLLWYVARDPERLRAIDAETARLQSELWSVVAAHASAQPTPVAALVANGMNDVLNSQGYTQAAWWNRIPLGAWALLVSIAIYCNVLIGYRAVEKSRGFLLVLPAAIAITLFLIADIDAPRGGAIRVRPQNLEAAAASFGPPAPGTTDASLAPAAR